MSEFEFISVLISMVVGLAIAQLLRGVDVTALMAGALVVGLAATLIPAWRASGSRPHAVLRDLSQ